MSDTKHPKVQKDAAERLVNMAYAFFHEHRIEAELPLIQNVRDHLEKGNGNTISMAIMNLVIQDHETAMGFMRFCNRQACLRNEDHCPKQSTIMGLVVYQADPVKLSKKQVRLLSEWTHESETIYPDLDIYFHPTTVSLERLMMAHPCEIASLHDLIPEQKRLPRHFTKAAEHADDITPVQVLLMVVAVPHEWDTCWNFGPLDEDRRTALALAASEVLSKGTTTVAPPLLLSAIMSGGDEDDEDETDPENEFSEALMQAILDLGTSELDAVIDEPDDERLEITLCDAENSCRSLLVDYALVGLSRSEAFMMVYDVMKKAGILGIMLNEEDDDDGLDELGDYQPDNVVKH